MKDIHLILVFLFCSIFSYSQNTEKKYNSEIVFLKDSNLKKLIEGIMTKKQCCVDMKGLDWYLEYKKDNILIVSQTEMVNLMAIENINNIYTTVIADRVLFIINKNKEFFFKSSNYFVDLSSFVGKSNYTVAEYSFWIIQKTGNNQYKIIKERIYKHNN